MIDKIIKKYNVNINGMIRNGTVAVITMFTVGILFGVKNIMLAFPIALTSTVLGRQNLYVKPCSKMIRVLILDLSIVTFAFISSINIWSGIVINFIAIFLIMYTIISQYDPTFYKPFIMLYIFTQYTTVSISELPERILSVILGVTIVFLASYIKKINEKIILGNSVESSLILIHAQIENILNNNFDEKIKIKCSKIMSDLVYKVYVTRHKNYLTTNLGKFQFDMYLYIEHLNLYLKEIYKEYNYKKISVNEIKDFKYIIELLIRYCKNEEKISNIIQYINVFINENNGECKYNIKLGEILLGISSNVVSIEKINTKEINMVYEEWERSELDRTKVIFKEYFNKDSIRFKFAMRMSITLTLALLVSEFLGFYKVIWAVITIMSIMQPYYEDTIKKAKDRIVGNIIAIIFTGVLINLINSKIVTIIILICALYLLYGFKEYSRISLFAAIASICISSLSENVNTLIIYRVVYVVVGVLVVLLANKFIFPYRLKDGITALIDKINMYLGYLLECSIEYINKNSKVHEIRDLIIHITLLNQKLYLRNLQYDDDNVEKFINKKEEITVEIGYKVLIEYEKSMKDSKELIDYLKCIGEELKVK